MTHHQALLEFSSSRKTNARRDSHVKFPRSEQNSQQARVKNRKARSIVVIIQRASAVLWRSYRSCTAVRHAKRPTFIVEKTAGAAAVARAKKKCK